MRAKLQRWFLGSSLCLAHACAPGAPSSDAAFTVDASRAAPDASSTDARAAPPPDLAPLPASDFEGRCNAPGVIRCVGFDDPAEITGTYGDVHGVFKGDSSDPAIDPTVKSSGAGALKFTIAGQGGANSAGSYFTNFSDDLKTQFDSGQEFFVQWRQRFSPEFLSNSYMGGGGWKQADVGEGDRPGCTASTSANGTCASSCTTLEVVPINIYHQGLPILYHSCGGKDDQYEPLIEPINGGADFYLENGIRQPGCLYSQQGAAPCFRYQPNEWMTFQIHIKIGTWYQNDSHQYRHDSVVQLWVAREGQPSQLVIDFSPHDPACQARMESVPDCQTGYDLANDRVGVARYGKVWLLPYDTGRDGTVAYPTAYTWYDELIVSTQRIADPAL
jgi:hypothetical protein